ncbi:MAG: flagellar hook-length control protein FliK [Jatrophihabitantaceae bacterium]
MRTTPSTGPAPLTKTAQGLPNQPLPPLDHGAAGADPAQPPVTALPATPAPKTAPGPSQQPLGSDHDGGTAAPSAQLPPGLAPVAAAPATAAPVAVAPTTPAPTQTPAGSALVDQQPTLTASLARLRSLGDGSHELSVQLHPAELGAVNVSATIRDGQLTVTVACADTAARAAVTAALPVLHQQLSSAGFGGVDVQFGGPSQDRGQAQQDQAPRQDRADLPREPAQPDPAPRTPRRTTRDTALDRLL